MNAKTWTIALKTLMMIGKWIMGWNLNYESSDDDILHQVSKTQESISEQYISNDKKKMWYSQGDSHQEKKKS